MYLIKDEELAKEAVKELPILEQQLLSLKTKMQIYQCDILML